MLTTTENMLRYSIKYMASRDYNMDEVILILRKDIKKYRKDFIQRLVSDIEKIIENKKIETSLKIEYNHQKQLDEILKTLRDSLFLNTADVKYKIKNKRRTKGFIKNNWM